MKVEESDIWEDPFVQDIRKAVDADLDALNKTPAVRALLATNSLDPLTAGVLIAATGSPKGELPRRVKEAVDLLESSSRLYSEGPGFLFQSEDTTVLKITVATLAHETTGEGFEKTKSVAAGRKSEVQKGVDLMADIADRLVESGAHLAIEPKLVERFAEGLDNMKQLEDFSSRRKMLNEASSALKYAMMQGNAAEVTHRAPRVDPDSQFIRLKNDAKSRFKLG
jgi:hypothetical protein